MQATPLEELDLETVYGRLPAEVQVDWLEDVDEGVVVVHEGNLVVEGDLNDSTYTEESRPTLIVFGDLQVGGILFATSMNVLVVGNLEAKAIYSGEEAYLTACGDIRVEAFHAMSYNDTTTYLGGRFYGPFLIESDHSNNLAQKAGPATVTVDTRFDDAEVLAEALLPELWGEYSFKREFYRRLLEGEEVLQQDRHEIQEQLARFGSETAEAVQALCSIEGVSGFRHWNNGLQGTNVLHALARVEAPEEELRGWIQELVAAGVPLDGEGTEPRSGKTIGTPLHVAIDRGRVEAARAFASQNSDINVGGGRLGGMILKPLRYMSKYPERCSPQAMSELLERAPRSVELAQELGYSGSEELALEAASCLASSRSALAAR